MNKVKGNRIAFRIAALLFIVYGISYAVNDPLDYLDSFENGGKQMVSVYQVDTLTIARGGVVFAMGKGEVVTLDFGWDRPTAMVFTGSGKIMYAPEDDVEKQQLRKFLHIGLLSHPVDSLAIVFTVPPEEIISGKATRRKIEKDEWERFSKLNDQSLSYLYLYLPNKTLDNLLSDSPGNFVYADFTIPEMGHLVYVEDPTQDDWYRIYDVRRSGGALGYDVLAGFSPFDRPPSERGVMPIDIYHYDIESRIEAGSDMEVTCRINYVPILQGQRFIYLDWYFDNEIKRVIDSDGKPVTAIAKKEGYGVFDVNRQEAGVGLILNKPLIMGDSDFVEITYKCNTLAKTSSLFYIRNETDWYPRTIFRDEATYSMQFDYPSKYQLISTGNLVSSEENDGRSISRYEVEKPVAVVGFNIGAFKSEVFEAEGFSPVAVYLAEEIADASMAKPREFLEQIDTGYVDKPMNVYLAEKYRSEGTEYESYLDNNIGDNRYVDGDYITGNKITSLNNPEDVPIVSGRNIGEDNQSFIDAGDTSTVRLSTSNRLSQAGADVANSSIFFSSILGPCPFDTIKATSIPENKDSRGAPGMVYLSWDSFIREDLDGMQESSRAERVAYQWFGHTVKNESYRDEWIINGLARYCGMWYYEISSGKRKAIDRMIRILKDEVFHGSGLKDWERVTGLDKKPLGTGVRSEGSYAGSMVLGKRLNSATFEDYVPVAYSKAAYIFHMIRYILRDYKTGSDDLFASFLKDIVLNFSDKPITNDGLQILLEKYVGGDMGWFFEEWVYGTRIPKYEFSYTSSMNPDNKYVVSCEINQSDVPGDFKMIVPVTLLFQEDKYIHMRVWVTRNNEQIDLPPVPYKPEKVIFNTYNAVLCDVDYK